MQPTRRDTLLAATALLATGAARAPTPFDRLEATLSGGKLGAAILDTATGELTGHRLDERFPLCSTFKLPLAAAILAKTDTGDLDLDRPIAITKADLVAYSPAVEAKLATGTMTIGELAEATVVLSDNAAANLLLPLIQGPPGLTRFLRAQGDPKTRLDRIEPALNHVRPSDPRDTTTPAAMARLSQRLLLQDALTPASRARLTSWLIACATGTKRLRAGLPPEWRAGDKTGTGPDGETNDVAIAWPPGRAPLIIAGYVDAPRATPAAREAALATLGRIAASAFDKPRATP